MMFLAVTAAQAQIVIGGSVYGGGNAGETGGSTKVTIHAGDINEVFGGARMANVGGSAFVHIDGAKASNYVIINKVYGGNDIAGTIGTSDDLPAELKNNDPGVDKSWNAFVHISTKTTTTGEGENAVTTEDNDAQKIYIGQLFGGGNGDYTYLGKNANNKYDVKSSDGTTLIATSDVELSKPELGKTYLDIHGGSIVYAYGGGNAATVKEKTVICLKNPSKVVNSIIDANNPNAGTGGELLTNDRFEKKMGINTTFSYPSSDAYQIGRLFGGNNKADMAIRPKWNLQRGSVRNLYGGGNEGRMTSPEGLLLQIEGAGMRVDNVYGGCRKADVRPLYNNNDNTPVAYGDIQLDAADNPNNIPGGYAARVRVLDGHVNNVYGGNDISGNVYGGNTVGIFTRIYGNVYGGGNGSYAYTDNAKLKDDPKWRDFYYNPKEILGLSGDTFTGLQSAEALNIFRPNAERVSILVRGTEEKPVFVEGALYVGGNSASLRSQGTTSGSSNNMTHIKIGSYVTIDNVFLGNNGENMVKTDAADSEGRGEGVLRTLARTDIASDHSKFNSMTLTDKDVFSKYMEGCAMKVKPNIVFESKANGDAIDYVHYSTQFGSIFCGGNVGSILVPGKITVDFNDDVIVYDKVVGGCNNANIYETGYNAEYIGGLLGDPDPVPTGSPEGTIGDKLQLNFGGLKIQPKRWNADKTALVWNTIKASTGEEVNPTNLTTGTSTADDLDRRLTGGNIYGGCYNTGHVNGNVVININASIIDRKGEYAIFDQVEQNEGEAILYGKDSYNITERRSGVILDEQGMDVLGKALNVFGGGYGPESEIWGSTTINLNRGYVFQIFGGGEKGAVGHRTYNATTGKLEYTYDPRYSCSVNLKGADAGVYRGHTDDKDDMAEVEFIYGGSFEAPIAGNTQINLGNGRIFNSFAGSCNADILGHTETYIGRSGVDANGNDILGFPWIRDHVYGGNDLGGQILGESSFISRVGNDVKAKMHNPNAAATADVAKASAYMEYIQGRVDYIFGGCYGDYDYKSDYFNKYTYSDGKSRSGFTKPRMDNAFVNFKPNNHSRNAVTRIYGAGQGAQKGIGVDSMQNRSYVLIEIPQTITKFQNVAVFGAGANCGLGMGVTPSLLVDHQSGTETITGQPDKASAIVDLVSGQIKNAYGGSFAEGTTRRTVLNVPSGATVQMDSIFGGAYGADPMYPCDVYEAQVNYQSGDARVAAIFGGNNHADRTLYGQVNVSAPVYQKNGYMGTVYGAGFGKDSWSQYTEVNLLDGANVWEVYGGGNNGQVLNTESLVKWRHDEGASLDLSLPGYEDTSVTYQDKDNLGFHLDAGLNSPLAHAVRLNGKKYNTNVHIHKGATVQRYAYGGGLGEDAVVSGTTYIDLLGGTVGADLYAGGTSGAVQDFYKAKTFTASTTAYIEGGTARNVYGGGWKGSVGLHEGGLSASAADDIPGETHVVIGIRKDQAEASDLNFYAGIPAIQRNAYGGGEGGAIYGVTNLTMNNGYIGYLFENVAGQTYAQYSDHYIEKLHDETWTDHVGENRLSDCGNLFGGGYDDNSSVDESRVTMWGGTVRNSIFGGGEIATIGRGSTKESGEDNKVRELEAIYKAGGTHIEMYNGLVKRNVFGGGKGYNILGYGGVNGFYTDGYVFGKTEVYIHGGEIGTDEGLAEGYGNVFGGGDVGFVYSGSYLTGSHDEGTGSPNHYYYKNAAGNLTEDCKVVIAPMLQVKKGGTTVSFGGKTYRAYDYVPTDYLNTLPADKNDAAWKNLYTGNKNADGSVDPDDPEERGIQIHNAVFGGGNVSSNSESYNNATTVFGNTTATLYDVYHHDFITVGTEHTGGLYGGGNLSLVGGYRELNITNYGTDYYGLDQQISLEEYQKLTNRERAYFKLEYLCQQDVTINGKPYKKDDRISEDDYNALPSEYRNTTYWVQYGFCSIYAGRLLNTIQRADFCGVYGSRLVLQGAKDRVADVADATEYTINRIGELSLNQQRSVIDSDLTLKAGVTPKTNPDDYDPEDYEDWQKALHGNYFGIYSVVNYLGALTSDVHFEDNRRYVDKGKTYVDNANTYYNWKTDHLQKRDRNNGTSLNQVALASGVYLELTTENSTPSNKKYGTITGIIELDLINIKKDIEGGGYVYARNEHGARTEHLEFQNVLLSEYNKKKVVDSKEWRNEARTHKRYEYSTTDLQEMQTSGNFIHKSKRIVDDCYPNNGIYTDGYTKSPAHYWFIKGEVYIYDQTVSAYAGSATAYRKEVKIPLTITAGSNGKLQLLNIQPSLYAYYNNIAQTEDKKIGSEGVMVDNESMTYKLNDVITWWDWHQLADNEKKYFVKDTYVNVDACTIDGTNYEAGTYVLENDKSIHTTTAWDAFQTAGHTVLNAAGDAVTDLTKLFRSSNNVGHDTGYVLTFDMNSPKDWDDWYSPVTGNSTYTVSNNGVSTTRKKKENYNAETDKDTYREGPTYTLKPGEESGLYGQRTYSEGEIISEETYKDYTTTVSKMPTDQAPTGQATVDPAYVALADFGNMQAGNAISKTAYDALADKSNFAPAMVCVNTMQLGDEDYVLMGELVSGTNTNLEALAAKYKAYNNAKINADQINDAEALQYIKDNLSNAYYIKTKGLYGGQYFEKGVNYNALKSWCELTESRDKFQYNYDALDVLIDPEYHGEGYTSTYYKSPYSDVKSVEYDAVNTGTSAITYYDNDGTEHSLAAGGSIDREAYEKVRNDQLHYTRIQIDKGSDTQTVYVVTENIINNGTPYAKGQDISEKDYNSLTAVNKQKVRTVTFAKDHDHDVIKYYCYEDYTPQASSTFSVESGTRGKAGSVISADVFGNPDYVPNYQKLFSIQGAEPTETTTLYVSRESNAKDVTSEKVISVVYQYTYYEADDEGEGVSLVNELHVVNIHVQLESGAPEIGPLSAPPAVLPGNTVGLKAPSVNPGLYEIITSGWELFTDENDAMFHRNGKPFTNNGTPLYWYQDQKVWLAFYSKTYLGKTYSNYVPLSVANYHDLDAVMKDKEHHLYVDHPDVARNSKIYIDNRDCESDATKSELDLLKDFFDLSLQTEVATTGATKDHALLDSHVKGGADLEFILNSDVSPKAYTDWTPIGSDEAGCFEGNFHGDGYTISGLNNSLFGKLCGNVYNLGVTGSFTSAGVVDSGDGYVENCWINTSATSGFAAGTKAVFGNPSDPDHPNAKQVVNCYYPSTKAYKASDAHPMPETDFYNGTVAYNLNGFYLNKRYYDKNRPITKASSYSYLKDENGTLSETLLTGYYPAKSDAQYGDVGYVERRYADGDFIYAGGTIPDAYDDRMRVTNDGTTTSVVYAPIWPDDYLYFGQTLTYGYNPTLQHNDLPTRIAKSGGRVPANNTSNRVYRAPAYYQGSAQDVAHFNLTAYLAAYSKPKTITDTDLKEAYPNMTAVDFAGHINNNTWALGSKSEGFATGSPAFYPPLLDCEDGLLSIANEGETPNLLVYAPSEEANSKTYSVLTGYFVEPAYSDYYQGGDYRIVTQAPTGEVHGHLVTSDKWTLNDHLLVDKKDFYCPIGYTMGEGFRMWYQRTPDSYANVTKGWETVSLPFTAELVTTHQKGEITHFYSGSRTMDDSNAKIGHEYWLREYKDKKDENNETVVAIFDYPAANGDTKNANSTFLWDYYYSVNSQKDANADLYQKYYETGRELKRYPLLTQGTPYIIGFPGKTYREFDLSGSFEPLNTAETAPAKLDKQVITFVSDAGVGIYDSESEMAGVTKDGYTFKPNYLNQNVTGFLMNADGDKFVKTTTPAAVVPFRPYFTATTAGSRTRSIVFNDDYSQLGDDEESQSHASESVIIRGGKHKVTVKSNLHVPATVRVFSVSGLCIATFDVEPGETVEQRVLHQGTYIVHVADGRFVKKVLVK